MLGGPGAASHNGTYVTSRAIIGKVERLAAPLRGNPYGDYLLAMIRDASYTREVRNT
jgi:hypothetical protein